MGYIIAIKKVLYYADFGRVKSIIEVIGDYLKGIKPGATGLEPATSGSTVQSSNQLSYTPMREIELTKKNWANEESNLRPLPCKGSALTN